MAATNTKNDESGAPGSPSRPAGGELSIAPVFTLVLWLGCLTVGAVGFVLPYARPAVICFCEEPVEAQKLEVELAADEIKLPEPPAPDPSQPPPPPEAMTPPPAPQPGPPVASVAAVPDSTAVAFAVPVLNPTRIAPAAKSASHIIPTTAAVPAPAAAPAPQAITFGQGEGRQPAPEYPRQSVREGQEGTVTVRLTVNPDGSVRAAAASVPSPWPLLNESALRTVLRRWRFQPGEPRVYEVAIRFELKK